MCAHAGSPGALGYARVQRAALAALPLAMLLWSGAASGSELVEGGVAGETRQALQNLQAVLEAGGASLGSVVKTTVYLLTMDDFPAMNEVYQEFFGEQPPARATVAVAGLPKGARVEIDAVARA